MVLIETKYLTENPCYKTKRTIQVKGLMLHSIGCPQPNPDVFVKNWNNANYKKACVHGFIGSEKVVITLPCMETVGTAHRAWHCGSGSKGSCNNTHIGIEMCEPNCIKYTQGSSFTTSDKTSAVNYVTKVTQNAAELFAKLCVYHNLDPLKDGVIISHKEGHDRRLASGHSDPDHLWIGLGMNYNMDSFRSDVNKKYQEIKNTGIVYSEEDEDMTLEKFTELMHKYRATLQNNNCHSYSAEARDWAIKNGLIAGSDIKLPSGETNYLWPDSISREQFVTVLYRFAKAKGLL